MAAAPVADAASATDSGSTRPESAHFIWCDEQGEGRDLYALFRRTFDVRGAIETAVLHVFADTAYQLFVNGEFVEFGPVRFDPGHPVFDSHDLAGRLKPGRNTIAVQVNHFGMHTFRSMPSRAGFIAWGSVAMEGGEPVSLATGEGFWRCTRAKAHARYAPALSFALNAAELYDQAGEEAGWNEPTFDDRGWEREVVSASQDTWGALEPRSIAYMSGKAVTTAKPPVVRPLRRTEEWHSFRVPVPEFYRHFEDDRREFPNVLFFRTYVYSPSDEDIEAGVFYGEHRLNGKPLGKAVQSLRPMRYTERWPLKKGWNFLAGRMKAYHDLFNQYFAVPAGKGIVFSADKDTGSPFAFETALRGNNSLEEALADARGWRKIKHEETAHSPSMETSWDEYGDPLETPGPAALNGHQFRLADYPYGFALLLDLDVMHLFFPRLQLKGVRGAAIDLVYSERLAADGAHVAAFSWYPLGDRVLCTRDAIDWMPNQPRGARYLKITVRNSSEDVTLESVTLRSANYPAELKGSFRCDDPCLTNVWELCRRTQTANMEDAYDDCAGRERGMYGRDVVIQYHNNLALFGDQALFQRNLQLFGQSPDRSGRFRIVYPNAGEYTSSDFALNILEGYRSYYEHSGDTRRIRADWDAITGNLRFFDRVSDERRDLLMAAREVMGGFGGDPGTAEGRIDAKGTSCFYSCAYLIALESALVLARAIGKNADADHIEARIATLKRSIPATFWDPDKKCFADTTARRTYSAHSNLFAVRAGAVPKERIEGVRAHVARELRSLFVNGYDAEAGFLVSASFAFFILDGLYKAGLVETAENLMRQGWGYFLTKGMKTAPEFFTLDQSLCHAWSASPVYYLSKYVLGIHYPAPPDLDRVEICVHAHSITEAEGTWPHPRGVIRVKWHTEDGRRVFDEVKAPRGVQVQLA